MPKEVKSVNSAEGERVTNEEAEKRQADQDAAVEAAFVEGTLPDEDRRSGPAGNVVPLVGDPNPSTVPSNLAIPAGRRPFIGPDGTLHRADGSTKREEHGVSRLLMKLPPNSRVTWSNEQTPAGVWRVELGPGNNKAIGEGATIRRALRMVGAHFGRHPDDQFRQVLLDQQHRPIHPNLDTDPDDPNDPDEQPKTVGDDGAVIEMKPGASEPEESTVETDDTDETDQSDGAKAKRAAKKAAKARK